MGLAISEEEYGGKLYDSDWMYYILYISLFMLTIWFPLFLFYSHYSKYAKWLIRIFLFIGIIMLIISVISAKELT